MLYLPQNKPFLKLKKKAWFAEYTLFHQETGFKDILKHVTKNKKQYCAKIKEKQKNVLGIKISRDVCLENSNVLKIRFTIDVNRSLVDICIPDIPAR